MNKDVDLLVNTIKLVHRNIQYLSYEKNLTEVFLEAIKSKIIVLTERGLK